MEKITIARNTIIGTVLVTQHASLPENKNAFGEVVAYLEALFPIIYFVVVRVSLLINDNHLAFRLPHLITMLKNERKAGYGGCGDGRKLRACC